MKILIAFECSGVLRTRFRAAGHDVWSCDLKPSEDAGERHVVADALEIIASTEWDLIIMHPECTALTVAGNGVYAKGKPKYHKRLEAAVFIEKVWELAKKHSKRVAMENPLGVIGTLSNVGRATQYIQPYKFGDNASKKTGLWLHNLPKLKPTKRVRGRFVNGVERWDNQTDSGQNKLGPSPDRSTERSRTYPGIADAIVNQWGTL